MDYMSRYGLAVRLVGGVWTSVRFRLALLSPKKLWFMGSFVTLSLTFSGALKWLTSLPSRKAEPFRW